MNWNDFIGGTIVQQHRAILTLGRRDTKLYCMRDKLLVLLMCCQVLMCPALCVAKCAHAAVAPCSQKAESACPCCGQQGSTDNNRCEDSPEEKGDSPNRPTQPEDCPDCFCSGTLVIGKEVATDLDFSPISHALATVEYSDIAQSLLIPVLDRTSSPRLIYGRFLLCTYGVLLI